MRYLGMVVLLTIFFVSAEKTYAADDTNTKTSQNTNSTESSLTWGAILEDKTEASASTISDRHVEEARLSMWREKQAHLWKSLPEETFVINASAYTAAADECGKSDGITASGLKVRENRTLACPPQYPFGVKIAIDGYGVYTCEDRGGAIKGNHFDIYVETKKEAFAFGRRNLSAQVMK